MKAGLGNLMRQAQEMQNNLKQAEEELANMEVTGESGGGMVKIVMDGSHDVKKVEIDPELMHEELSMLEDLVAAALNDANHRVSEARNAKLSNLTAGLNIPGLSGFNFPA